jgi:restriction system protein
MLRKFPEFLEFLARTKQARPTSTPPQNGPKLQVAVMPTLPFIPASSTPDEQIDQAVSTLTEALRDALLARILEAPPAFFERLIIDLLLAMGYGGSRSDAADQLGGTGDGGVDGVIREDQLGLDRIYLQAKRYQPGNAVGSEAVQAFIGALVGKGAQKGVLLTTSTFSRQALAVANQSGSLRLVLIDGDQLTRLMIRVNVGIRVARTIEVKRVDVDYFEGTETD